MLSKILNDLYAEGPERVGFVLNNRIVEVENICSDPMEGFQITTEAIMEYAEVADATWHTHPDKDANLSSEDYVAFKNWPNLKHYIIGNNGVRCYRYDRDKEAIIEVAVEE